jgi:hypothetical protein
MPFKYIRGQDDRIVLFSASMEHKATANAIGIVPKSAGVFITDGETSFVCGSSLTLDLNPLPDDKELITQTMLGFN